MNHFFKQNKHFICWFNRISLWIEKKIKQKSHLIANILIALIAALIATFLAVIMSIILHTQHKKPTHSHKTIPYKITKTAKTSSVTPHTTAPYRNAPPSNETARWRKVVIKHNDSPILIFKALGLDLQDLHTILALGKETQTLLQVKPGQTIHMLMTEAHKLVKLVYHINLTDTLYIVHSPEGFYAYRDHRKLVERIEFKQASTIQHSLFNTAYKARLSDNLVMKLVDIFGWNIDFARALRPSDGFKVLYRAYYLDGSKVKDGAILEAQFTNQNKTYTAIAFEYPKGTINYYTPAGLSLKRPFLRTPVKYTRISSTFSLGRYHPILHRIRAHKGVDYAAPYGTPIHATSDGHITFIGKRGGYGNAIIIAHGKKYSTLYGHMAYFAKGIKKNQRVHQGQVIGYVGKTGLATGTHLHYEFRINGVHHDPLKVKLPTAHPIHPSLRKAFDEQSREITAQFERYTQTTNK